MRASIHAAVTTPFDVVKTRLQTEGVHSAKRYHGSAVVRAPPPCCSDVTLHLAYISAMAMATMLLAALHACL